ncbi:MAG: hypothetical protein A4E49_02491 [Methanosaeta sp. PtaU1.Bin112]|nr:MAG: hypothetical protein A4E49_02491 [Methanosaeta sp. PtaU1.Bin112]
MRMINLLLPAILLSVLSLQAYAIEPGDIAEPSIPFANMKMPTPKITSPNMGMPEPKQVQHNLSDSKANQTENKNDDQSDVLSGKWSIRFEDRPDSLLDLTLWSSGKTKFMGYGTLARGSKSNSVTASGTLEGDELALTVSSADSEYSGQVTDKYDLVLFLENSTPINSMSGTYILSSGGEFMGDGKAKAAKR